MARFFFVKWQTNMDGLIRANTPSHLSRVMVSVRKSRNPSRISIPPPMYEHNTSKLLDHILIIGKVPIKWESVDVTPRLKDGKTVIPDEAIDSVTKNYVALKGPLAVQYLHHENWHDLLIAVDARRQRPCLAQSYPPPNLQPLRQRPTLQIDRWLQDPLRWGRYRSDP